MPALEPMNVAETIKNYPFFMEWLQELGRSPEEVVEFCVQREVEETEPVGQFKQFVPTDWYTASITFDKKGDWHERRGRLSEGKMTCVEAI